MNDSTDKYSKWIETINAHEGGFEKFSRGYEEFGFQVSPENGDVRYREWAPNAESAYLIGDFSTFSSPFL